MKLILYGIPNCDQVKKARIWLDEQLREQQGENQLAVYFHDFKKAGITVDLLRTWLTQVDRNSLINRKGTTWRKLSGQEQAQIIDDQSAISCMLNHPSIIKRPILVLETKQHTEILVGFSEDSYRRVIRLTQ